MNSSRDDILSYREMCDEEGVQTLQRGMNFRLNPQYSVVLMSRRSNAPYRDSVLPDGVTIEYEGHDIPRQGYNHNPKLNDQISFLPSGKLTQNGLFIRSVEEFKKEGKSEPVKIYEKIMDGVWSLKGMFDLIDYDVVHDGKRSVFKFKLKLSTGKFKRIGDEPILNHLRIIPSEVKQEVWKRDGGVCVLCGSNQNLHFDHDLPFSKGGTSLSVKNVRLLCMKHNLQKSGKIQ